MAAIDGVTWLPECSAAAVGAVLRAVAPALAGYPVTVPGLAGKQDPRTTLGDILWRSEAGLPLPDHRTPAEWADDLAARFAALGIAPGRPL
jgi:hypothetical protein